MEINTSLEESIVKPSQDSVETIISWKICSQYVYLDLSDAFDSIASLRTNQTSLHHLLEKFSLICLLTTDKDTLWVLKRKLSMHHYCSQEPDFEIFEKCSVSLFPHLPHILGCAVRRCSLLCCFHQIQRTGDGETPSDKQTYSMTAGEGTQRDMKTNKKPLLISAKCVSFTARLKLMGPILSDPKNTSCAILTFNVIGFVCMLGEGRGRRRSVGGGWDYSECHPTSSLNHPLSIHRRPGVCETAWRWCQ